MILLRGTLLRETAVALSAEDIRRIAHLARLQIEEQDIPRYADSLSEILGLVEQLRTVDTQGVLPMAHPQDVAQRLRADEVTETDQRARFPENARADRFRSPRRRAVAAPRPADAPWAARLVCPPCAAVPRGQEFLTGCPRSGEYPALRSAAAPDGRSCGCLQR